jgi:hypothetical protein
MSISKATLRSKMSAVPHLCSAAQRTLLLPELLTMILTAKKWADDKAPMLSTQDLARAIRVNRFWFEIGSRILWADWQSIDWLYHVPPNRRQLYASKMPNISLREKRLELYYDEYKDLVFDKLTLVTAEVFGMYNFEHVKPYLVSSLQSLSLFNVQKLESEVFSYLTREELKLQRILISAVSFLVTLESFLRFIRHAPLLKVVRISISQSETPPASVELLSSLAHNSRLEKLQLPWYWTESASQQAAAAVCRSHAVPFPKLTDITLRASSNAVEKLVPLVANAKHLTLTVKDSTEDVLPHVSSLRNLMSLIINYQKSSSIPAISLNGLGALSRLLVLQLNSFTHGTVSFSESDFSDNDCEVLARRLPNLQVLRLQIKCNISTNAVESFLRHCPNFHRCEIFQQLDTTDLFISVPGEMVFPQLRTLFLGGLSCEELMRSVCNL